MIGSIASFLNKKELLEQCGIIYSCTTKETEEIANSLRDVYGINAAHYHASLSDKVRNSVHESWLRGETKVICATVAFGMGINKADVRFVIHSTFSKSLENYY